MPRRLADQIADFCRLIDDKGDPGDLFVREAMRARYEAAVEEMHAGTRPWDFDRVKQFTEWEDKVAAAKAAVLNGGEALWARLEAANKDSSLLGELLDFVRDDKFKKAKRIRRRVLRFLKGALARDRAGGPATPNRPKPEVGFAAISRRRRKRR
jgi:hypothetical protein